jgi:hypothetical protein
MSITQLTPCCRLTRKTERLRVVVSRRLRHTVGKTCRSVDFKGLGKLVAFVCRCPTSNYSSVLISLSRLNGVFRLFDTCLEVILISHLLRQDRGLSIWHDGR